MVEQTIEQDIKTALLGGDSLRVTTLRGLKSAILNVKVATGARESGISDDDVLAILGKESKKRQESIDLYVQAGDQTRADQEIAEKAIIDAYLPAQLGEAEVIALVDAAIAAEPVADKSVMGKIIGSVKQKAGPTADGGLIAKIVKEKLGL